MKLNKATFNNLRQGWDKPHKYTIVSDAGITVASFNDESERDAYYDSLVKKTRTPAVIPAEAGSYCIRIRTYGKAASRTVFKRVIVGWDKANNTQPIFIGGDDESVTGESLLGMGNIYLIPPSESNPEDLYCLTPSASILEMVAARMEDGDLPYFMDACVTRDYYFVPSSGFLDKSGKACDYQNLDRLIVGQRYEALSEYGNQMLDFSMAIAQFMAKQ